MPNPGFIRRITSSLAALLLAAGLTAMAPGPAAAQTTPAITVHYWRPAGDYDGWTLWTWQSPTGAGSKELARAGADDWGLIFRVTRGDYGEGGEIGVLPKLGDWKSKDAPDRIWKEALGGEVWIISGDPALYSEAPTRQRDLYKTIEPFLVHYHRPAGDYDGWTLWTWNKQTDQQSKELSSGGRDGYGLIFRVNPAEYGSGVAVGVLPRKGNWQDKDAPDRIWNPALGKEVWIMSGSPELFASPPDTSPFIVGGFVDAPGEVVVRLSTPLPDSDIHPGRIRLTGPGGLEVPVAAAQVALGPAARLAGGVVEVTLLLGRPLDITVDPIGDMKLEAEGFRPGRLTLRKILDGPEFTSDVELGAVWSPGSTTFRVFAPTASSVTVNLYTEPAGGQAEKHWMKRIGKGVWEAVVDGDLNGRYYTLSASGSDPRFDPNREVIDPYSRCNTAHHGRGMVIHDTTSVADRPVFPVGEAVIYEMHVRDFTISPDSGIRMKGKYLGVAEEGTHLPDDPAVATGLAHLLELGVNAVQIMPIQDFENDETGDAYNWGYMPVHFNSPDGWYATSVHGPARVVEAKKMIDSLHRKGIRVVMDVVYNHTAENTPDKVYSFNGLVPGYYYRLKGDGTFWNGSGTGNEFRSEAPMARRFLLDSVKYWVNEYKVDGYRFDLMGLIDLETMTRVARELRAIDPDLLIYGEPWTGGETPIRPTGKGAQKGLGFAVFGDNFRDALKGGVFDRNPAYVQVGTHVPEVKTGLMGSIGNFALNPLEALNYVECHDNHTLWDRLEATTAGLPGVTDEDRVRMDKLAAAAIFTAQGIPFIECGQEFLRTKGGESNSYNKPDSVNQVVWSQKKKHADVFDYYRGLIALRKAHPMFRMTSAGAVTANLKWLDDNLGLPVPVNGIGFRLDRGDSGDSWSSAVVLFNPEPRPQLFALPAGLWSVFVNDREASGTAPVTGEKIRDQIEVAPRSAMVLAR